MKAIKKVKRVIGRKTVIVVERWRQDQIFRDCVLHSFSKGKRPIVSIITITGIGLAAIIAFVSRLNPGDSVWEVPLFTALVVLFLFLSCYSFFLFLSYYPKYKEKYLQELVETYEHPYAEPLDKADEALYLRVKEYLA